MSQALKPTVIVLAAGQGRRFRESGGAVHKLEAGLGGVPVLQRVLDAVVASGLPFHIVRPPGDATGDTAGMGDSIARGVRETAEAAGWLILPGDLPLVRPDSLLKVAQGLAFHPVVLPFWAGRPGHPVGFGRACRPALLALHGDRGASGVLRAYRQAGQVGMLDLDDPGIVMDIDTTADLTQAEALLAGREAQDK